MAAIFNSITGQFTPYNPPMLTSGHATPGAAASGIPVTLMSSDAQWLKRKVNKYKKRVPLSKQISIAHNTIDYIWHAATPFHAKYGAIPIPNAVDQDSTFSNNETVATHLLPCHLYDLTCAPNYIRRSGIDGLNADATPRALKNPNVMYQVLMKSGIAGNLGVQDWIPQKILIDPSGIGADGSAVSIFPQQPDGQAGSNKWYVKYMKKPCAGPSLYNLTYFDTVPVGTKVTDTNSDPSAIVTPPVGRRPIHVSTDVKMCLVGCTNEPVTYDISLVRFNEDFLVPEQSWDQGTGAITDVKPTRTQWECGASNAEDIETTGVRQGLNANAAVAFWQQFCLPFTHGPGCSGDSKLVKKYCQVLGKKVVTIQPKSTVDGDQVSNNHTYVSFKFKWNDVMSFAWRKDADCEMNPAVPYNLNRQAHGLGFTTDIMMPGNITTSPSPRSRIFLVVRARSEHLYGGTGFTAGSNASTLDGSTVAGATTGWWHTNAGKIPTYDISIVNRFIPDLAAA